MAELDVWMVFQVIATSQDATVESLEQHIEKLRSEDKVVVEKADFESVQTVDKPAEGIEEGFSQVCELELTVNGFDRLVEIVVNYGPTAVDVKGPEHLELDLQEMQSSLNLVASMMHQFLQAGVGGTIISRDQ